MVARMLLVLLGFQLAGEVISRGGALPIPGPVVGLMLFIPSLLLWPALMEAVRPVAKVILDNLALLFVPAGVGIVGHLNTLASNAAAFGAAIIGSTVLAMLVGVVTFRVVARLTGGDR